MLRVLELLLVVRGRPFNVLKATMPSFTALLTTKAEAWPVRVATHAMSHSRHTHHATAQLRGYGVGMDDAERS